MENKAINSFGSIVIPAHMREELGINGTMMLSVGVRQLPNGDKEIFIRRPSTADDILSKYQTWLEVVSRVAESSVALVWKNQLISISSTITTQSFIGKRTVINPVFQEYMKAYPKGAIINNEDDVSLLISGPGVVSAFYKVKSIDDGLCYFVIVKGSKHDKELEEAEEIKRYNIIRDILSKI